MGPAGAIALAVRVLLAPPEAAPPGAEAQVLASGSWDGETRLRQAVVLDRLIRKKRAAPVDTLVRLFPGFRNEVTILLVRHPDAPTAAWASLIARTNVGDEHWIAFANALLKARSGALADHLYARLPRRLEVHAILADQGWGESVGMTIGCPLKGSGPRRPCYELADRALRGEGGWVQLSVGAHPVFSRRDEIDGDGANCGHCSSSPSVQAAPRYVLAYLTRLADLPAEALEPLVNHAIAALPAEPVREIQSRARVRHDLAWQRLASAPGRPRPPHQGPPAATDPHIGAGPTPPLSRESTWHLRP